MAWQEIQGHDRIVEQFRRALEQGRLASSFLFVGPPGIGKRSFALKLAQALLCETSEPTELDPCGRCPACQQTMAGSHPDLLLVSKPADRNYIPLEFFIGDRDHRMREGLCHDISLKPFRGGRRVAVIDDADYLNQEGANCLLKTLEEPPPKSVIMLVGTSLQKQLSTIRSRCQIVRFAPLSDAVAAELLVSRGLVEDPREAERLAVLGQGSLSLALELADEDIREFRHVLFQRLSRPDRAWSDFSKTLTSFVEAAGKEAPPRRARMRQVFGFAVEFYRQRMRSLSGVDAVGDDTLRKSILAAEESWPADGETAAEGLSRSLDALLQVNANANQTTLLECWLDDLTEIARLGRLPVSK